MNQQTLTDDQLVALLRKSTFRIAVSIQGTILVPGEDDTNAGLNAKVKLCTLLPKVEEEIGQLIIRDEFKVYNADIERKDDMYEVPFVLRTEYLKHGYASGDVVKEVNEQVAAHIDKIEKMLEVTLDKNDDYAEWAPPL